MIIDFHVHGKITSTLPFDEEKFLLTIKEARENGLDSIVVTEHLNANNFLEGYHFLKTNYNYIHDYYDINGFKVFYGMEVTTSQNLDFLIIGQSELVLKLREEINTNLRNNKYIDISNLFNLNISEDLLIILAHPYRKHEIFPKLEKNIVDRIDAIELNSKDLYKFGIEIMKDKINELATNLNLPITSGSDAHYFIQVSTAQNIFNKNCNTIKEIKKELKQGNYNIKISNELNIRVKSSIIIKKLICKK